MGSRDTALDMLAKPADLAAASDAHFLLVLIPHPICTWDEFTCLHFFTCSLVKLERKDLLNALLSLGGRGLVLFITTPHI